MRQAGVTLFVFLFCAVTTVAEGEAKPVPPPPCSSDAYRAFDFWLGKWRVETPDGQLAGHNTVTSLEGGCLILEDWTSVQGGTGQSYNFYNPVSKTWRQVWVSQGGIIDYTGGLNEDGAMQLEGTIAYQSGTSAKFRGTWTPLEGGVVQQKLEQWDDEKEAWQNWFTGLYHPVKD